MYLRHKTRIIVTCDVFFFHTAKPIDLLARYITVEDDEDSAAIEMHEPYTYLNVSKPAIYDEFDRSSTLSK